MNNGQSRALDLGLLVLRLGIGAVFIVHGVPKFLGGPELWAKLGGALGAFGIGFAPAFWGFLAACAEALGGVCLVLGIFVRPAAVFMFITMIVAARMLGRMDGDFTAVSHPLSLAVVFSALMLTGGGKYALGAFVKALQDKWFR